MSIRYAIGLPNVGDLGDPLRLVELAILADESGWDGVYLWDHVLYRDSASPVANPTVTAAAIAASTRRVRLIVMHVLPRRRTHIVARESVTLDILSGGRLTLAAAIGSLESEYTAFGESPRGRGAALDAALADLRALWTASPVTLSYGTGPVQMVPGPVQRPGIPIWCGGRWPNLAPLRRAARFDGAMPTFVDQRTRTVPPSEFAAAAAVIAAARPAGLDGFDLALEGVTRPGGAPAAAAAYAPHGLTWWVEDLSGHTPAAARARIAAHP